jgi:hypothetical protein
MRAVIAAALVIAAGLSAAADEDEPKYRIELKERYACATPTRKGQARADGGSIDVRLPSPDTLSMRMTGATAAISYLGCTSSVSECFRLVQQFEITCSDPKVSRVVLTLESSLVGYLSSSRKAGACVRLAGATVTPCSWDSSPLSLTHPASCVASGQARQCNQHLPPIQGPPMPLGRYTLVADFVIDATASGICNARAVADFSPEAKVPGEWVQTNDPFQNANKDGFGFFVTITAARPGSNPPPMVVLPPPIAPSSPPAVPPPLPTVPTPPRVGPPPTGLRPLEPLDREGGPRR